MLDNKPDLTIDSITRVMMPAISIYYVNKLFSDATDLMAFVITASSLWLILRLVIIRYTGFFSTNWGLGMTSSGYRIELMRCLRSRKYSWVPMISSLKIQYLDSVLGCFLSSALLSVIKFKDSVELVSFLGALFSMLSFTSELGHLAEIYHVIMELEFSSWNQRLLRMTIGGVTVGIPFLTSFLLFIIQPGYNTSSTVFYVVGSLWSSISLIVMLDRIFIGRIVAYMFNYGCSPDVDHLLSHEYNSENFELVFRTCLHISNRESITRNYGKKVEETLGMSDGRLSKVLAECNEKEEEERKSLAGSVNPVQGVIVSREHML